jgi:hypothetical protein
MSTPKIFISYSHDSDEHKAWVEKLASDLRSHDVPITLDQWHLSPGRDITSFTLGIRDADRVLLICSEPYVWKADYASTGGVANEWSVIEGELLGNVRSTKFIPLLRNNDTPRLMPSVLGRKMHIDFRDDSKYEDRFRELLNEILQQPQAGPSSNPDPSRVPDPTDRKPGKPPEPTTAITNNHEGTTNYNGCAFGNTNSIINNYKS